MRNQLSTIIRDFISTSSALPVSVDDLCVDKTSGSMSSIAVQLQAPAVSQEYIDGSKELVYPFSLILQVRAVRSSIDFSTWREKLDDLARWIESHKIVDVAPYSFPDKPETTQYSSIMSGDDASTVYILQMSINVNYAEMAK